MIEVLAANLRRLRIARHLSLSELARATSMSKATLSGIENGRANPTIETLSALAAALRVQLVELLEEPPVPPVRVVRAAGPRVLEPGHVEEVALAAFAAREYPPAGGRVGLYVLDGALIAGPLERSSELGAGDYMAFAADVGFALAAGRAAARALVITWTAS
jgi:transcriptional regulator with XRE-family HTH domain